VSNFLKIDQSNISLAPDKKVIKAKDYATYVDSKEILKASEERARQQEEQATTALSGMIKEALMKANQKAQTEKVEQMIATVAGSLNHLAKLEQDIAQLVIQSVRKIITDYSNEEQVYHTVRNGLKAIGQSQRVTVRVSPQITEDIQQRLMDITHKTDFIDIVPDHKLNVTDCILESDIGIVNASIEHQLDSLEQAIMKSITN
jgi:type III secretion protein L